jgi:hypothetical protein
MHRPLADHENLDRAMCRKEMRTLSQALTLRYDKVLFILDPSVFAKRLAGKKVVVCDYPDGRLEIMEGSTSLPTSSPAPIPLVRLRLVVMRPCPTVHVRAFGAISLGADPACRPAGRSAGKSRNGKPDIRPSIFRGATGWIDD